MDKSSIMLQYKEEYTSLLNKRFPGLWGSALSMLDCIYVAGGIKPTCISFLSTDSLYLVEKYCKVNSLCYELSDYKIIPVSDKGKGGFSNKCSRVSQESPEGCFAVFLARDNKDAKLLKYYYANNDHIKTGALLGYPRCCTRFFLKNRKNCQNNDYVLCAIKDTEQHDFLYNRSLRYFDTSLLSHFPCSFSCSASKAIAKRHLDYLQKKCPEIAVLYKERLKSLVIYTEEQGIFFADDYYVDGICVRYSNIYGTMENDLFLKLKNTKKIEILSPNCILIGSTKIEGDIGIMLFK